MGKQIKLSPSKDVNFVSTYGAKIQVPPTLDFFPSSFGVHSAVNFAQFRFPITR